MHSEPASFPDGRSPLQNPPTHGWDRYKIRAYTTYDAAVGVSKETWTVTAHRQQPLEFQRCHEHRAVDQSYDYTASAGADGEIRLPVLSDAPLAQTPRACAPHSQRRRTPAHAPIGAPGDTSFSFVQSSGSGLNVPLGVNTFVLRNPAVEYLRSNKLLTRANRSR